MQELLGRLSALDPQASLGLRVIACFDELIIGNVGTRGLLSAAASLAGCDSGFCQDHPQRRMRVTPRGELSDDPTPPPTCASLSSDGLTVWLARTGAARSNDAIILERLALAVRIRHGRGRRELDNRRDLGLLVDQAVPVADRRTAAARLNLAAGIRYRVVAAPLFAVWQAHPAGAEDVVATTSGPIHALVVPHDNTAVSASPAGVGLAATPDELHRSFRTAVVALKLCDPPRIPVVQADRYGGLVGLLADLPDGSDQPDADSLGEVMTHAWAAPTLDALVLAGSVRQAARLAGVHHSTLQTRIDTITETVGFDPLDGIGRSRLGLAYLLWRLRNSRVLDLPAPQSRTPSTVDVPAAPRPTGVS